MGTHRLKLLSRDLGIDFQACVEAAFDLGSHVAESESGARHAETAGLSQSARERQLRQENAQLRYDCEKVRAVNHHLWQLLREEHQFLVNGWLRRMIQAACVANDQNLIARLTVIQERLDAGGPRNYKRGRGHKKPKKGKVTP